MSPDREKIIKICIAAPLGMLAAHLLGYSNVITTSVSMILVCAFGSGNTRQSAARYSCKRVFAQIVVGIAGGGLTCLLKASRLVPEWLIIAAVSIIAMPVILYLDCRFRYASAYLITAAVGLLVMASGTLLKSTYALQRVLLVFVGCVLGFWLNCLFSCRSLSWLRRTTDRLLRHQEELACLLASGQPQAERLQSQIAAYKSQLTLLLRDAALLHQDRKNAPDHAEIFRYLTFLQTQELFVSALETVAAFKTETTGSVYCLYLKELSNVSLRLLSGECEPPSGSLPVLNYDAGNLTGSDIIIAGSLLAYRHELRHALTKLSHTYTDS